MLQIKELVYTTTQTIIKTNTYNTDLPIKPTAMYILRAVASNFLDPSIQILENSLPPSDISSLQVISAINSTVNKHKNKGVIVKTLILPR